MVTFLTMIFFADIIFILHATEKAYWKKGGKDE